MGEMPGEVHQYYFAALRSVQPNMADAYENTAHCSVSFLTHTTTLNLTQACGKLTEDAFVGQTVLPSWRDLEALGPFRVDAPPPILGAWFSRASSSACVPTSRAP